jgi:hypothetical protein
VHQIGEAARAEIEAVYDYRDEQGRLVYQVVRKRPKTFLQRRPDHAGGWIWKLADTKPLLYRLPEVLAAVAAGDDVYIVEGEKDADAMAAAGAVATCNSGGAGKFRHETARYLAGGSLVIVRDRDEAGHQHARDVFRKVKPLAKSVRVVDPRAGKDAADHLAAGLGVADFVPVWPTDDLRSSDPVAWKRAMIRTSLEVSEPYRAVTYARALEAPDDPTWPTGLEGGVPALPNFRGVTIVAGSPGAAKSFLAMASSVQAAFAGWDVLYLASEMGEKSIARRVRGYCNGAPPERWRFVVVDFGAGIDSLIGLVADRVGERNLLVVFDSISSFVDQAQTQVQDDPHAIGLLKRVVMWALNVKRRTEGGVSFLVLSEVNKEGQTKGRFGDHKADLVVSLKTDERDTLVKEIRTVKGWEYQLGQVGMFRLDPHAGRLWRVE